MLTYEESSFSSTVPDSIEWSASTTACTDLESIPFNPENFLYVYPGLVSFIKNKLQEFDYRKNFTDHYLYFCSTINYLHHVDKRYKDKEYVPINYKIMVSVISKYKYPEIVSNLETWKVVESNESYRQNTYGKGYKLLSPYDSGIKRIPVKDVMISNKINRFKMSSFKELKKLPYPYQYLSMTNTWIEIDRRRASYYNTMTYFSNEDIYNSNFYSISAYADGDYRFSVDTTGYRAHTNLTNLKTDLRKFLSVDGEQLGQVDIKNSQPLFFYLHIKDNSEITTEEKERFKEIVENGKFYEFFMEHLGIPPEKRSSVKNKILTAIFFDRNRSDSSRYVKILESEFPEIANYISEVREKDYRTLSHLLQSSESQFVIENVVAEFIHRFGDGHEFVSTIHDSIVVRASMLDEAENIMRYCFEREGLLPQLSVGKF